MREGERSEGGCRWRVRRVTHVVIYVASGKSGKVAAISTYSDHSALYFALGALCNRFDDVMHGVLPLPSKDIIIVNMLL